MTTSLRLALCQINATVGDLAGNAARIGAGIEQAKQAGADLVLFPELALTGYPPEDLLLREHFLKDTHTALLELATLADGIVAIVGFPERAPSALEKPAPGSVRGAATALYNSAAVLRERALHSVYRKVHLPNYGVFDEQRYFRPGDCGVTIELCGCMVGLTVCEDLWVAGPPAAEEAAAGASLIVNISASPYHAGKGLQREQLFAKRAREDDAYVAFCALVGGQDELLFDGHSFVLDPNGETVARAAQFQEDMLVVDIPHPGAVTGQTPVSPRAPIASREQEIYEALKLGLHDYVEKNGFAEVVLGLSGGIDSALVACLAADALGPQRVNVAVMPSPYSSSATQGDARALAQALGVRTHELTIAPVMDAYTQALSDDFAGMPSDITEENLQARIRGNLLMALSNKFGWLVLTTGNKSEMSVGYTTLYGDLAGGFAVIKDVPKTLVYQLSRWREIPTSILERAPSAELREHQTDQDSLPSYEVLDRILQGYVELDRSREQLIAEGLPATDVERATRLVDLAEYKRRQAPPGIKISERAFGRDRRMPITNSYRA